MLLFRYYFQKLSLEYQAQNPLNRIRGQVVYKPFQSRQISSIIQIFNGPFQIREYLTGIGIHNNCILGREIRVSPFASCLCLHSLYSYRISFPDMETIFQTGSMHSFAPGESFLELQARFTPREENEQPNIACEVIVIRFYVRDKCSRLSADGNSILEEWDMGDQVIEFHLELNNFLRMNTSKDCLRHMVHYLNLFPNSLFLVSDMFPSFAHQSAIRGVNSGMRLVMIIVEINASTFVSSYENQQIERTLMISREEEENRGNVTVPASESSFSSLAEEFFAGEECNVSCVICMEDVSKGTMVIRMPCKHIFHGDCIRKWLRQSHSCPLCRHSMLV